MAHHSFVARSGRFRWNAARRPVGPARAVVLAWLAFGLSLGAEAGAADQRLRGQRLVLRDRPGVAGAKALSITSATLPIGIGAGNGSLDDPTLHGATLRVTAAAGDTSDVTYVLPKENWTTIGAVGENRGYRYRGQGPVGRVTLRAGRGIRIGLRNLDQASTLEVRPDPLGVILRLGSERYCMQFGGSSGSVKWREGRRLVAAASTAPTACAANLATWPMHPIDDRFRGSNALAPGDVNRDGFVDYATNYEFDQRYVVQFHPGTSGNVREPWPTVVAMQPAVFADGEQLDTESVSIVDLDGDGNDDLVGTSGGHFSRFWEGYAPGVRVVWGPTTAQVGNPAAWLHAGRIPSTIGIGHLLWQKVVDVNGDGAPDIMAGGRLLYDTLARGGIFWLEAPVALSDRRNLALWTLHWIDPITWDGHGFQSSDIDEDGDFDLIDANADFDTPENEEAVFWYENPGPGTLDQLSPWPRHTIYVGDEFYAKPQLEIVDLDGDGLEDFLTAVADDIYWFRKVTTVPVFFDRVVIPKPLAGQWLQRPIRVADVNDDGKLDLIGMMTHDSGDLPSSRASAFWMEWGGASPLDGDWTLHPIKWGPGKVMNLFTFGEKWDQTDLRDVDDDGDLDIAANCEEWWEQGVSELLPFYDPRVDPSAISVVWFENRIGEAPPMCQEVTGSCVLEAEHYADARDGTWVKRARFPGYQGDGYVHAHNIVDVGTIPVASTRGLRYAVHLAGGNYRVWLRRWVPSVFGFTLGGIKSDSAWLSVDGGVSQTVDQTPAATDGWEWIQAPATYLLAAGTHFLDLRVRERGYAIDRIVLTSDAGFVPSGAGPAETLVP